MSSIVPLMTKLAELKRLHTAKYGDGSRFVVCNQFTAQQLSNEAQVVGKIRGDKTKLLIDELTLVIHPQDHTQDVVMEVA